MVSFFIQQIKKVRKTAVHKISASQMDVVLACLDQSKERQIEAFEALKLNPYDHYEDNSPDFILVVRETSIESHLDDLINYPEAYLDENDKLFKRLTDGKQLNGKEIEQLKADYIEQQRNEEDAEYMVISLITDERERVVIAVYTEMMMGQLGINFVEFFGFYASEEEATRSCQNIDGIVVDSF